MAVQETPENKTIKIDEKRLQEMIEKYKVPIANKQSESNQLNLNIIDHLIQQCLIYEYQFFELKKTSDETLKKLTDENRILTVKSNKSQSTK